MNYSRNELLTAEATMNQMRNAITHLARFMVNNGVTDKEERLRRMGRNIAKTYVNYWRPTKEISFANIKDVITTIYQKILNSSVSIVIDEPQQTISVKDAKCSLCKYRYEDIEIAGCEILLGLVSELVSTISEKSENPSALYLKPLEVKESRAYGGDYCLQAFKFSIGGR